MVQWKLRSFRTHFSPVETLPEKFTKLYEFLQIYSLWAWFAPFMKFYGSLKLAPISGISVTVSCSCTLQREIRAGMHHEITQGKRDGAQGFAHNLVTNLEACLFTLSKPNAACRHRTMVLELRVKFWKNNFFASHKSDTCRSTRIKVNSKFMSKHS